MAMVITRLSRVTGRSSNASNSYEFSAMNDSDDTLGDHDDLPLVPLEEKANSGRSLGSSSFKMNRMRNSRQVLEGKRKAASKSRRSLIMDSLEAVSSKPPSSTSLTVASTPSTTLTKSSATSNNNNNGSVFKRASGFISGRSSIGQSFKSQEQASETPPPPPESEGWAQLVDEEEIDIDQQEEDDMSLNDTPSRLNLRNNEVQTFEKWADTSIISLLTTGDTTVTSHTIASSRTLGRPLPPKITQSQTSLQSGYTRGTSLTLKPPSLKDLNTSSNSDEDDNTSLGTRQTTTTLNILKPPRMKFTAPQAQAAVQSDSPTITDDSASIPQSSMDPLKPPSLGNLLPKDGSSSQVMEPGSSSHIDQDHDGDENDMEDSDNSAAVMTFMPYEQFDPTKLTSASTHKKNEAKKKREAETKEEGTSSSPKVHKKKRPSGRAKTKRKKKSGAGKPKSSKRNSETSASAASEAAGEPSTTTTPTAVRRKLNANGESSSGPSTPKHNVRRKSGAKRAARLAAKKETVSPPAEDVDSSVRAQLVGNESSSVTTNPTSTIAADCESTVRSALTGDTSIISTPTSVKNKLNTIADVESSINAVRQRLDAHAADEEDVTSTPTSVRKTLNPQNSPTVTRRRSNRMDRNALVKRSSDSSGVRAVLAVSNLSDDSGSARAVRRTSSNSVRSAARATTTGNLNVSNRSEESGSRRRSSHSRRSEIDTSIQSTTSQNSGSARESRRASVRRTAADNRRSLRRSGLSQSPGKHKNKLTAKDIMTSPGKRKTSGYISSFLGGSGNEAVSGLSLGSIYKES